MQSKAETVEEYLLELPKDRREIISVIREIILHNLPGGFEEVMQYGMISYVIPLDVYPDTYNKQPLAYVSLASQKNYVSLYLYSVYADSNLLEWFVNEFEKAGKKLNMGKSCVRFSSIDQLPLDVIGRVVASTTAEQFIRLYEDSR
jgi:hypothetical protein